MMEVGLTALSEEIRTKRSAAQARAASAIERVPKRLLFRAWAGWSSMSGTCLWAAAWKTTCGRRSRHRRSVCS
jgi:hypothetical protein